MYKIAAVVVQYCDACPPQIDAFATCEWADDPKVAAVRFQLEKANSVPYQNEFLKMVSRMQLRARFCMGTLKVFDSPVDLTRDELEFILKSRWERGVNLYG